MRALRRPAASLSRLPMTDRRDDRSRAPPAVSVIVRSTARPSLPAALASVAAQHHPATEVVVVDALGHGHPSLPAHCGAHPMRLVGHGRPLPRPEAAQAGLDAARGDAVIFLDDDDVFLAGHLERLAAALASAPDAVAAYADVEYGHHDLNGGWRCEHRFAADFDPLRLRFENYLPLNAVLVHRAQSPTVAACRFDPTLAIFEDWDWLLQLAAIGRFVHVAGVSARYVAGNTASGVFAGDEQAARYRDQLQRKWLPRLSAEEHLALLAALQRWYRDAHRRAEELALEERTVADLRGIVAAREAEVAAALANAAAQADAARAEIGSLKALVDARQREVGAALAQIDSLRALVAARDAEVAAALAEIDSHKALVAAREQEIADLQAHAGNLAAIVAARDAEIAQLQADINRLLAETPLQALKRTLRQKNR